MVGGLILGVINTVLTESVMAATDQPCPVTTSTCSCVRFVGAIAPTLTGVIADRLSSAGPYYVGAAALGVATVVLLIGRRHLTRIERPKRPGHPAEGQIPPPPTPAPAPGRSERPEGRLGTCVRKQPSLRRNRSRLGTCARKRPPAAASTRRPRPGSARRSGARRS